MKEESESKLSIRSDAPEERRGLRRKTEETSNGASVEVIWHAGATLTETERQWLLRLLFQKSAKRQREPRASDDPSSDGVRCSNHKVPRARLPPPRGWPTTREPTWPI